MRRRTQRVALWLAGAAMVTLGVAAVVLPVVGVTHIVRRGGGEMIVVALMGLCLGEPFLLLFFFWARWLWRSLAAAPGSWRLWGLVPVYLLGVAPVLLVLLHLALDQWIGTRPEWLKNLILYYMRIVFFPLHFYD